LEKIDVFEVIDPGVLTTVQDLGRYGFSQCGVPPSGALDTFSFRIANLLAGNSEDKACLEITLTGLKLIALREVVIAITGGDLCPVLNGDPLEMWRTHLLVEGDVIAFKSVRKGCRSYLAVGRGLFLSQILGSRSTYLSGKFGGLEGRPLRKGDILPIPDIPIALDKIGLRFPDEWIPPIQKETLLRVIPGPQDSHFTKKGFGTFSSESYQVTPQCDRVGIRLEGPRIERKPGVEDSIISEGLIAGAIQVPGDGKPIVILSELVTGGYAKIATVISADLARVAQLKPGDHVRFEPASITEAHLLLRQQEGCLKNFRDLILKL
jgi:antagonist of KipI